jgi:hypothetical protein
VRKFNRSEALQIVKRAAIERKRRSLLKAAAKLAALLPPDARAEFSREMEKQAFFITGPMLLAGFLKALPILLSTAAGAAGAYYASRSTPQEARAQVTEEMKDVKKKVQEQVAEHMKTMRPRVFMATPRAPQPKAPTAAPKMPTAERPMSQLEDIFRSPAEKGMQRELTSPSYQRSPLWGGRLGSLVGPQKDLPWGLSTGPIGGQPVDIPWGPSTGPIGGQPVENPYKLSGTSQGMTKEARLGAILKLLKTLRHAAGRAGRATAGAVGTAAAGAKYGLGKVLEKMPGQAVKGWGKGMVSGASPYFGGPIPSTWKLGPGATTGPLARSYIRQQLGKKVITAPLRFAARSVYNPSTVGFYYFPFGGLKLGTSALRRMMGGEEVPEGYTEEELQQAAQLQSLLDAHSQGYRPLRYRSPYRMELPGFDITEIPMGASYEPHASAGEAGMPEVQGPGQEVGVDDKGGRGAR